MKFRMTPKRNFKLFDEEWGTEEKGIYLFF